MVPWLGLYASTVGGVGSIPGWGGFHVLCHQKEKGLKKYIYIYLPIKGGHKRSMGEGTWMNFTKALCMQSISIVPISVSYPLRWKPTVIFRGFENQMRVEDSCQPGSGDVAGGGCWGDDTGNHTFFPL